jgi:hypothetical protein
MAGRKAFDDLRGKIPKYQELADAARALLPYLETSSDPRDESRIIEDIKRDFARSDAEKLRQRADEIEAKEAAIWRFRKAVEALSQTVKG